MELEETLARFTAAGATIVAVSTDDLDTATEHAADAGLTFPLVSDPDGALIRTWGVRHRGKVLAVPAAFVVDRGGVVRWSHIGESMADRPDVEEILNVLGGSGQDGEALPDGG